MSWYPIYKFILAGGLELTFDKNSGCEILEIDVPNDKHGIGNLTMRFSGWLYTTGGPYNIKASMGINTCTLEIPFSQILSVQTRSNDYANTKEAWYPVLDFPAKPLSITEQIVRATKLKNIFNVWEKGRKV